MNKKAMTNSEGLPIVVGIGASAGGLESFKALLSSMPIDTGLAFVLVQHLAPHHESLTPVILSRCTLMPVIEIKDKTRIEINHVYVLPPNQFLKVMDGLLYLIPTPKPEVKGIRTTIDNFFSSLADSRKEKAIGIILSGTGNDGVRGTKAIKEKGGLVIAQDPTTADFSGMPQNVISAGMVDHILSIEQIPEILINHRSSIDLDTRHSIGVKDYDFGLDAEDTDKIVLILNFLKSKTKNDFFSYKKASLKRRIHKRLEANHIKSLSNYYHFLQDNPAEVHELQQVLMIRMTHFFRNLNNFEALIQKLLPFVIKDPEIPFRVWVPGCSTGEEAYSIAMLLMEQCSFASINKKLQIFATDIDEEALDIARKGVYSRTIEHNISPERIVRFFDKEGNNYVVKSEVRANVLFIQHNLLHDIPFSKLDLISCRNLFIYLESEIQMEVIKLFHFALKETGYLFLGNSEMINREDPHFEIVSKKHRIFKRVFSSLQEIIPPITLGQQRKSIFNPLPPHLLVPRPQRTFFERAKQQLLEEYVPTSVLINSKYEILYFYGTTSRFLKVPEGSPTLNLLSMARGGLAGKIKKNIKTLIQSKKNFIIDRTYIEEAKEPYWVEFKVSPLQKAPGKDLFIISFKEIEKVLLPLTKDKGDKSNTLIKTLERELKDARGYLQNTIEDLAESNEELKIYNEEVISVNEELQATNEEMETSKEELQSLNEELTVVNSQLQEKIEEQEKTNNDLINLLRSTNIATIFLDTKLYIQRFTLEATELFNLRDLDLGRPLKDITMRCFDPDLLQDAQTILEKEGEIEQEVSTEDDRWFLRKCRAYKTIEGKTSGVIITFSDVTRIKSLQLTAHKNEQKLLEIFNSLPIRIAYVTRELNYTFCNKLFLEWARVAADDLMGHSLKLPDQSETYQVIKPYVKQVLLGQAVKFDNSVTTASGVLQYEEIVLIPDIKEDLEPKGFFILLYDITERQQTAIAFLKAVIDTAPDPMCVKDDSSRLIIVNKAFCEKSGKTEKELLERTPHELYTKREADAIIKENKQVFEKGYFQGEKHAFSNHKEEIYVVQKIFFKVETQKKYIVCSYQNITEVSNSKAKLQKTVQKLRRVNEDLNSFAHVCSHDLQEPARTILSFAKLFSEQFKPLIDEDAKKYLHYIIDGCERMEKMIQSTLSYARISNQIDIMEPVNCETLLSRVLENLNASIEEFDASITHDKLPTVIGDAFKLSQLFQNLISNALKFRSKEKFKIHIGVKPYKSGYTFFVKDNGIGINMAFKGKLFKLFGRLNKQEDYPGTGIGLAICKKIVEDYGGKIWVESELGKGTTFYFTLLARKC